MKLCRFRRRESNIPEFATNKTTEIGEGVSSYISSALLLKILKSFRLVTYSRQINGICKDKCLKFKSYIPGKGMINEQCFQRSLKLI